MAAARQGLRCPLVRIGLAVLPLVLASACGGSQTRQAAPHLRILMAQGGSDVLAGGSLQLKAEVQGQDAKKITWFMKEGCLGTISQTGLYRAPQESGKQTVGVRSSVNPKVVAWVEIQVHAAPKALALIPTVTGPVAPGTELQLIAQFTHGTATLSPGNLPLTNGQAHSVTVAETTTFRMVVRNGMGTTDELSIMIKVQGMPIAQAVPAPNPAPPPASTVASPPALNPTPAGGTGRPPLAKGFAKVFAKVFAKGFPTALAAPIPIPTAEATPSPGPDGHANPMRTAYATPIGAATPAPRVIRAGPFAIRELRLAGNSQPIVDSLLQVPEGFLLAEGASQKVIGFRPTVGADFIQTELFTVGTPEAKFRQGPILMGKFGNRVILVDDLGSALLIKSRDGQERHPCPLPQPWNFTGMAVHPETGRTYLADALGLRVMEFHPETGQWQAYPMGERVGAMGDLAMDGQGNLLLSDPARHCVHFLCANPGADANAAGLLDSVETLLGSPGQPGYLDGPMEACRLNRPSGLLYLPGIDALVLTDTGNDALRMLRNTPEGYSVHTLATGQEAGWTAPDRVIGLGADGFLVRSALAAAGAHRLHALMTLGAGGNTPPAGLAQAVAGSAIGGGPGPLPASPASAPQDSMQRALRDGMFQALQALGDALQRNRPVNPGSQPAPPAMGELPARNAPVVAAAPVAGPQGEGARPAPAPAPRVLRTGRFDHLELRLEAWPVTVVDSLLHDPEGFRLAEGSSREISLIRATPEGGFTQPYRQALGSVEDKVERGPILMGSFGARSILVDGLGSGLILRSVDGEERHPFPGSGPWTFSSMAVHPETGRTYLADPEGSRLLEFNPDNGHWWIHELGTAIGSIGDIALDRQENVYLSDPVQHCVYVLRADRAARDNGMGGLGDLQILLGRPGQEGHVDGPRAESLMNQPTGLLFLPGSDALVVTDTGNGALRTLRLTPEGPMVHTVATAPEMGWRAPDRVIRMGVEGLLVRSAHAGGGHSLHALSAPGTWAVATPASEPVHSGAGTGLGLLPAPPAPVSLGALTRTFQDALQKARQVHLDGQPTPFQGGLQALPDGTLVCVDGEHRLHRITLDPDRIHPLTRLDTPRAAAPGTLASQGFPMARSGGDIFVADGTQGLVRKLAQLGRGPASELRIRDRAAWGAFTSMVVNPALGMIHLADPGNGRIVNLTPDGQASWFRFEGLTRPGILALGPNGMLYVADAENHVVARIGLERKAEEAHGCSAREFRIIAGTLGIPGHADGATGASLLNGPMGLLHVPEADALVVADSGNHCLRAIGLGGDGLRTVTLNPGSAAALIAPQHLTRLANGSLLVTSALGMGQRIQHLPLSLDDREREQPPAHQDFLAAALGGSNRAAPVAEEREAHPARPRALRIGTARARRERARRLNQFLQARAEQQRAEEERAFNQFMNWR